jgi:hypothetical protein
MKVSILINNYNYAGFVGQSIESALAQDHPDVEVVVVDDCSTDDSQTVIRGFGSRVIAILKQVNAGHAAAFNSGFAACSGALVMFLDADDYLYPNAVSALLAAWRPGVAMIQGLLDLVNGDGVRFGQFPSDARSLEQGDLAGALLRRGRVEAVVTSGLAFDRGVLDQIMPVPEIAFRQGADGYLASVAPLYGSVALCAQPIAAYRQHNANHSQFSKRVAARARWQIEHDRHRHAAIRAAAAALGLTAADDMGAADCQHLSARIASLRLEPADHPLPGDRAGGVARRGARTALATQGPLPSRIATALWFLASGNLPIALARPLIEWRLMPSTRPTAIKTIGRGMRRVLQRFGRPASA